MALPPDRVAVEGLPTALVPAVQSEALGYRVKVTVPVGECPPVTVAVSVTSTGTVPPEPAVVAMLGAAWEIVTGSDPQVLATPALLASPLKVATHWKVPTPVVGEARRWWPCTARSPSGPPGATCAAPVCPRCRWQGRRKSLNVTVPVPVGLTSPVTVATSVRVVPTIPPLDAVVLMPGDVLVVVSGSEEQAVGPDSRDPLWLTWAVQ